MASEPATTDPQPPPPLEPDAADCCGEGCVRCIYDLYDEALQCYRAELAAWRQRHPEADARDPAH